MMMDIITRLGILAPLVSQLENLKPATVSALSIVISTTLTIRITVCGHNDPDRCPTDEDWFMCGDICTHRLFACICGNVTLTYLEHPQYYCCQSPNEHCTSGYLTTECATGAAIHKSEPCYGFCPEKSDSNIKIEENHSCEYTDHCNYQVRLMCGDVCGYINECNCTGDMLNDFSLQYCCTPPEEHCSYNDDFDSYYDDATNCSVGIVSNFSERCNGHCFNSYRHSSCIWKNSHYSCPDGQCAKVESSFIEDRCRGVLGGLCSNTTGDCDDNLFCHQGTSDECLKQDASTRHTTPVKHNYCSFEKSYNNGSYEDIGRTDEKIRSIVTPVVNTVTEMLIPCNTSEGDIYGSGNNGLLCDQECKVNWHWCYSEEADTYGHSTDTPCKVGDTLIQSDDRDLCQDNLFWRDIDCNLDNEFLELGQYGSRCQGPIQHCVYAWYYDSNDNPNSYLLQSCLDHSDQMIYQQSVCPEKEFYLQLFHDIWSPRRDPFESLPIYDYYEYYFGNGSKCSDFLNENESFWCYVEDFSERFNESDVGYNERYPDPHKCQNSCSSPGPGCSTCQNETYFQCHHSGVCIPYQLRCDGHPQCEHAEDENVETCFESWVNRKLVSPAASLRCSSKRYPGTPTLATPCDGIVDCYDGSDEALCKDQTLTTFLISGSVVTILIIYLGIKYTRKINRTFASVKDEVACPQFQDKSLRKMLEKFEHHRDDSDAIAQVNTYLLHILHTKKIKDAKRIYVKFYDLEAYLQHGNKAKIFHSLHHHLDPLLVDKIVEAALPGFCDCILSSGLVISVKNAIISREWLSDLLFTTWGLVKVLLTYVDILGDTCVTVSLLWIVGGPMAIFTYPTQFTSVVVIALSASVILPLMASSLHLSTNHPYLLFNIQTRRSVTVLYSLLCSWLIPVILINSHEAVKEQVRIIIKKNTQDCRILGLLQKCRTLKYHLVEFLRIELGTINAFLYLLAINYNLFIFRPGGLLPGIIENYLAAVICH